MGYQTPNMIFTDSYREWSCTAGRSSFITGQTVYRTGLFKVCIPGAPIGMNEKIITIAGRSPSGMRVDDRPRREPPSARGFLTTIAEGDRWTNTDCPKLH